MSDPATLTPPADAPLPWTLERGYIYSESRDTAEICDANGVVIWAGDALPYSIDSTIGRVARYLVACANAAPGLEAERDAASALSAIEHGTAETLRIDVEVFKQERDTALARVAELEAQLAKQAPDGFIALHDRKAEWSIVTFGPGNRYTGVVAHIRKELTEIEADPADLTEWCDVILLAMDGAMRSCGATGAQLLAAMQAKQARNEKRAWPDWRTLKPDEVSEHIKLTAKETP